MTRTKMLARLRYGQPRLPGLLRLVASAGMVGFTAACPSSELPSNLVEVEGAAPAIGAACVPLRIVLFQDISQSGSSNRTPRLSIEHLQPILEHLQRCGGGGEIAVGTIGVVSNHSLLRLKIPAAPPAPGQPEILGTAFQQARARRIQAAAKVAYDEVLADHLEATGTEMEAFLTAAGRLLGGPAKDGRTDIWGAVARSALFLGEPTTGGPPVRLVVVAATDAADNVHRQPVRLPDGTILYLVNGEPSPGALATLAPLQFESLDAAIYHLLHQRRVP